MTCLWDTLSQRNGFEGEFVGSTGTLRLGELRSGSMLGGELSSLRGQTVMLCTGQLAASLALIELDGVVRRMVLCTADLTPDILGEVAMLAEADAVIHDGTAPTPASGSSRLREIALAASPMPDSQALPRDERTEWILLTSGTTRTPKLVQHSLSSLAGALPRQSPAPGAVWSTFYDIRRYGGLQMYLRALLGGTSMVLSHPGESTAQFFTRAAAHGVTHISGTPSHWRQALMSGAAHLLEAAYVRLSGEVVDQPVLDALRTAYPAAQIGHAFASTEAGVAFEVNDGLAGFPSARLGTHGEVTLKIEDGTLRIRSPRVAARYLGIPDAIADESGFVDTGDLIECVGERCHFRGRRGGIINVGGHKVFPEEVEAVLNADPRVRMSLVRGRRSPITGALVAAEVVLAGEYGNENIKADLLSACRRVLPPHKVPTSLRIVDALQMTAAGKLRRHGT